MKTSDVDWREPLSGDRHQALATDAAGPPRLLTRSDVLRILRIGETTLFWLQRTGKLHPIRIGSRVLFTTGEIERIAAKGASLTDAEKQAAQHYRVARTARSGLAGSSERPKARKRAAETGAAT